MWRRAICALLCVVNPLNTYAKNLKQVEADENRVVGINTALGYSTILEFGSKPLSAVLGDQDAFKLEFVGNSITVKPLIPHAKSNLFIFTEFDRFNCTLRTGSATEVDYIVKIRAPRQAMKADGTPQSVSPSVHKTKIGKSATRGGFTLKVVSKSLIDASGEGREVTLVDFEIASKQKFYAFSPASFGVKQRGKFLLIESIYLDAIELHPRRAPIRGKIALLSEDFNPSLPFTLIFAVPKHRIEVSTIKTGTIQNEKGK